MSKITAVMVADSLSPYKERLSTLLITFPRFILAELNTHRMLSKNSASSRAIPFKVMVNMVRTNPFVPIAWQKEHSGMQGTEYITDEIAISDIHGHYLESRDFAVRKAQALTDRGVTKQLANRLLEPFMWHTVLISGTEWENFFELRCPRYVVYRDKEDGGNLYYKSKKDLLKSVDVFPQIQDACRERTELQWLMENKGQAEIHMMALAEAIYDAMNESVPRELKEGEWHIPYEDKIDRQKVVDLIISNTTELSSYIPEAFVKVSTAMAARTSYTVVGDEKEISYERLLGIYDRMAVADPFHASPFEHCARAMTVDEHAGNSKTYATCVPDKIPYYRRSAGWCRNYRGFIQLRHILEQEKNGRN